MPGLPAEGDSPTFTTKIVQCVSCFRYNTYIIHMLFIKHRQQSCNFTKHYIVIKMKD